MTYREAVKKMNEAEIDAPEYEASLLFERFAAIDRASLVFRRDEDINSPELLAAIEKRLSHTPLQYILGEWEFFGLSFKVNENCLCPRPDTELTVETALRLLPKDGEFLELCTGSGCISVALCHSRSDLSGIATDKFESTAGIAAENAERNRVGDRLKIIVSDLFDEPSYIGEKRFDALISNPPYIPAADIDGLSAEVAHEPRAALDGGEDGLDFYRHIVKKYAKFLKPDGKMIFEIGFDRGDDLRSIAGEHGFFCEIIKDLEKNDRVAVLKR